MKKLIIASGFLAMAAFAAPQLPANWANLNITDRGMVQVEKETDENGLYVEYKGLSREELLGSVVQALNRAGYVLVGTALDGVVAGFANGKERLALKIDQFGDSLFLAIFNEKGKEPLLHGMVFGQYTAKRAASGDQARELLLKGLEKE
ncbi:hypothetical protein [Sedimenticola hydrogenitrophicus]|uniref:hypothetical protein n=1 Tax=Sedimenticola hydrogenitrophicus TaxID=2967975 RepID=UPI0021A84A76|nr:hypothetical protein [Sedimenticola hydrogenitrophicus]